MAKHWMSKAFAKVKKRGTEGVTRKAAHKAGESTRQWAESHQHDSDPKSRGRALLALRGMNAKH